LNQSLSVQPIVDGDVVEGAEARHLAPDAGGAEVNESLSSPWPACENVLDELGGTQQRLIDHASTIRPDGRLFFALAQSMGQFYGLLAIPAGAAGQWALVCDSAKTRGGSPAKMRHIQFQFAMLGEQSVAREDNHGSDGYSEDRTPRH
jgi:hypothetical protein